LPFGHRFYLIKTHHLSKQYATESPISVDRKTIGIKNIQALRNLRKRPDARARATGKAKPLQSLIRKERQAFLS